jgi:hypothetical protein
MDPNANWRLILKTFREIEANPRDQELRIIASSLLLALSDWIRRGGFPPTVE